MSRQEDAIQSCFRTLSRGGRSPHMVVISSSFREPYSAYSGLPKWAVRVDVRQNGSRLKYFSLSSSNQISFRAQQQKCLTRFPIFPLETFSLFIGNNDEQHPVNGKSFGDRRFEGNLHPIYYDAFSGQGYECGQIAR